VQRETGRDGRYTPFLELQIVHSIECMNKNKPLVVMKGWRESQWHSINMWLVSLTAGEEKTPTILQQYYRNTTRPQQYYPKWIAFSMASL
jgi:hypothetical protein